MRCAYCGASPAHLYRALILEHVIPEGRTGDTDWENSTENTAMACDPCNTSKRNRTPLEWVFGLKPARTAVAGESARPDGYTSMRFRLPELLAEHGLTPYALAQRSNGKLPHATVYRIVRRRGCMQYADAAVIVGLMETLVIGIDDVLEFGPALTARGAKPSDIFAVEADDEPAPPPRDKRKRAA